MSEAEPKACNMRFIEDSTKGWKLLIDELTPKCEEVLKEAAENLGPHSKSYLAKRIETSNPEVKKFLEKMGLSVSQTKQE